MQPTALIAIGGNALIQANEPATVGIERIHVRQTCRAIADVVSDGWRVVITHGNGPQVGAALVRSERAAGEAYPLPLDVCVASTQGATAGVAVTLISPGNIATNIRRVDNRNVLHANIKDPIPGWLQMSADRAARGIVKATLHRRPEVVLTRLAKLALLTERIAPALVSEAIKVGHIHGRSEPGLKGRSPIVQVSSRRTA